MGLGAVTQLFWVVCESRCSASLTCWPAHARYGPKRSRAIRISVLTVLSHSNNNSSAVVNRQPLPPCIWKFELVVTGGFGSRGLQNLHSANSVSFILIAFGVRCLLLLFYCAFPVTMKQGTAKNNRKKKTKRRWRNCKFFMTLLQLYIPINVRAENLLLVS